MPRYVVHVPWLIELLVSADDEEDARRKCDPKADGGDVEVVDGYKNGDAVVLGELEKVWPS